MDTVGTYLGNAGGQYLFSAEATGGGATDSFTVPRNESTPFFGKQGDRYVFGRSRTSADIQPYSPKHHYGIAGAPLKDTPEDMEDSKWERK